MVTTKTTPTLLDEGVTLISREEAQRWYEQATEALSLDSATGFRDARIRLLVESYLRVIDSYDLMCAETTLVCDKLNKFMEG